MADKFLVIDGSSLIHRAFFALPPLTTRQGIHTGAVYGLCNMLLKLLDEVKPRYMAVAFDKSRKTFRERAERAVSFGDEGFGMHGNTHAGAG